MVDRFRTVVALAFVCVVPVVACSSSDSSGSGGFSCTDKGKCANDSTPDQASRDGCNALLSDRKCGGAFKALGDCAYANSECSTVSGKSELKQGACDNEQKAYSDCLASKDGGA